MELMDYVLEKKENMQEVRTFEIEGVYTISLDDMDNEHRTQATIYVGGSNFFRNHEYLNFVGNCTDYNYEAISKVIEGKIWCGVKFDIKKNIITFSKKTIETIVSGYSDVISVQGTLFKLNGLEIQGDYEGFWHYDSEDLQENTPFPFSHRSLQENTPFPFSHRSLQENTPFIHRVKINGRQKFNLKEVK